MSSNMIGPISCNYRFPFENFFQSGAIVQNGDTISLFTDFRSYHDDATSTIDVLEIQSFYKNNSLKFIPTKELKLSQDDFSKIFRKTDQFDFPTILKTFNYDQEFSADISKFLSSNDSITKFVSCTRERYIHSAPLQSFDFIKEIASKKWNGFIYGYWNGETGILGVTPEPALIRNDDNYTTFSIAGTATHTNGLHDSKISDEQAQVTNEIVRSLDEINSQNIKMSHQFISANGLNHIQTKIDFKSDPLDFNIILAKITPSGALGVVPTEKIDFLKTLNYFNHDKEQRLFGGNFILKQGDGDIALVMIRSVNWAKNISWIDSGCGITKQSTPEMELDEAILKRDNVKELFYGKYN